ncbi:MAG: hypothetical protein QXW01_03215 [Candidatus Aenigmatarchaeota archaeon]
MPIFARTKLIIHEDCLATMGTTSPLPGKKFVSLEYNGPNPQIAYYQAKKILASVTKMPENEIIERDFSWDRSGEEEKFSVNFDVVKDMDKFSFIQITVSIKGKIKPSKEFGKEGNLSITIDGALRTEYPQDTLWQRSLLYELFRAFYHKFIYEENRKKYKEECVAIIMQIYNELKEFLNVLPKR